MKPGSTVHFATVVRGVFCAVVLAACVTLPEASGVDIIWVTENTDAANEPSPDDIGWTNLLEANGHTVSRRDIRNLDTDDATLAELEAADLVIMSRDTNSGNYANNPAEIARWNGLTTPLISMSAQLVRSTDRWRWFAAGVIAYNATLTIRVEVTSHPIFAGVALDGNNEFVIADVGRTNPISTTTAGNGTVLATEPGTGYVWIAFWPANTDFFAGGPQRTGGPRVFFAAGAGVVDDNPKGGENFTAEGEQVFLNTVNLLTNTGADSDLDGLTDSWELIYFQDLSASGSGDPDGDGLNNQTEFTRRTNPTATDSDADGLGDAVETDTGTYVSAVNTGTKPTVPDTDGDGLNDGVENNTGTYAGPASTGSNPLLPDTDTDTLPDGWEVRYDLSPVSAANAPLDPDADTLSTLTEFGLGTNPVRPDTDGDGLGDGAETKTGAYVSPANTGTDPLLPDTDGDALVDGAETNTGTFVSAMNAGTNPHAVDSDSDKFMDGEEVRRGFNPTAAPSHPPEVRCLFIGANPAATFGADGAVLTYIETRYGSGNITYNQASAVVAGDETAFDLLVISSSPASADMRGKFHNSTTPIFNWEEAIADNNDGEFGLSAVQMSTSTDTTLMNLSPHPITAGLPARITFAPAPVDTTATSSLFPGLTSIATAADGTVSDGFGIGNAMVDYPMVFIADTGEAVDPLSGVLDGLSPARRVHFPMRDGTFALLTADARTLFGQALDWAAGLIGGAGPTFAVTAITLTSTPTGSQVSLTWTSKVGRSYRILADGNLSEPVSSRAVLAENIPATGTQTQFTVSLPPGIPNLFLVVQEQP
jgi:hypothetical protein